MSWLGNIVQTDMEARVISRVSFRFMTTWGFSLKTEKGHNVEQLCVCVCVSAVCVISETGQGAIARMAVTWAAALAGQVRFRLKILQLRQTEIYLCGEGEGVSHNHTANLRLSTSPLAH